MPEISHRAGLPTRRIERLIQLLEPQLLDTCALQNLDWVDRQLEGSRGGSVVWTKAKTTALIVRYGRALARDLIDLGILYKRFEYDGGYPWCICSTAAQEAGLLKGPKGVRVRELIDFIERHQSCWSPDTYPWVATGEPLGKHDLGRVSPLILKGLGVTAAYQVHSPTGPLAFLHDKGDRLVAAHALLANVPVVLTTDLKTFWSQRRPLEHFGLRVMRPSELLRIYRRYWSRCLDESP